MKLIRHFMFCLGVFFFLGQLYALIFGCHFSGYPAKGFKGSAFGAAEMANDPLGKALLIIFNLFMTYLLVKIWMKKR